MSKEQHTPDPSQAGTATPPASAAPTPRRRSSPAATKTAPKAAVTKAAAESGVRRTTAASTPAAPAATQAPEAAIDGAPPAPSALPLEKLVRKALPIKEARPKKASSKKARLVRDSFTFPENDYALFATLKQRALATGGEIKKSELVRAGLTLLNKLDDAELARVLGKVERIKTGRPKKK